MSAVNLGKIAAKTSALFLCDMQEAFRKTIKYYPAIIETSQRLLNGAQILNMPVITTEQYPKGLGHTVSELDVSQTILVTKTQFSMAVPEVVEHMKKMPDLKSIILCGIETHVCIQNTALDLLERGYDVHVVADACSSRSMVDRMFALQRVRDAGAFLTTSESALLGLVCDAAHPKFREVQRLIWEQAPDSDLLPNMPK
ncbi:PREDICTED: isochorismatase domain-containing protein 2, mitochondrial-like [Priapulus caudatus]|uniref:Isochorismatase domain-containing protein 2, mitochondrial-like n=1 Tax=Priapulus caudatus TaxID=37621 RepID=A0ABM1E5E8_PRICU|nr:PREDICTED: isochorismatase domain-containing protein 2, mitochondrial-like [Priapulus caudatus]